MDNISYRNNRQPQQRVDPVTAHVAPKEPVAQHGRTKRSGGLPPSRSILKIVAIIVAIALIAFGAWYAFGRNSSTTGIIDGSKYQAVFFTNGQVYFGKLSLVNDDYMRLKGVYYLQNKTKTEETSPQSATAQDASDVELIKLGNEIHGPEDEMLIAKDQVLFFENLKPAGTVSQTITNFQKNK